MVVEAAHADFERKHVPADQLRVRLVLLEDAPDHALARELVKAALGDGQDHELLRLEAGDLQIENGPVLRQFDDAGKVLDYLQPVILVFEDGVENSAILRAEDDFEEVQLSRVMMHVDRHDRTWPRPRQKVLVAHLPVLLAEAANFVHLITVEIDVEQLVIVDQQAVDALSVNVHLLGVLLAGVELQLVDQVGLPPDFVEICPRNLFPLGGHGPNFAILYVDVLQSVFPLWHFVKGELFEVECFLQGLLVLLEPKHAVEVLSVAIEERTLPLWSLLVWMVELSNVLSAIAHPGLTHHANPLVHSSTVASTSATLGTAHHIVRAPHAVQLLLVHGIALRRPHGLGCWLIHVWLLTRGLRLRLRRGNICWLSRLIPRINGECRCLDHQLR